MSLRINEFNTVLLHADIKDVHLGSWGGRYVQIKSEKMNLNAIVQRFCTWAKGSQDHEAKRKILSKIRALDQCHPENTASLLLYVLTRIRQFIGNLRYDRNAALAEIEKSLPEGPKPPIQFKVIPPEPLKPERSVTPPRKEPVPEEPSTPAKPGPIVPRRREEERDSRTPNQRKADALESYKLWDGEGELEFKVKQQIFPSLGGSLPFWVVPERRKGSGLSTYYSPARAASPSCTPNIQTKTLFDMILTLNGITEEEVRKDYKNAVYLGNDYRSVKNYESTMKKLLNAPVSVKYIGDSLIFTENNELKTTIIEACADLLSPESVLLILKRYCAGLDKKCKKVCVKDATIEKLIKCHVAYCLKNNGEGFDKAIFMQALALAMQSDGTIEIDWIGKAVEFAKSFLSHQDIVTLMETYHKHHKIPFQQTAFIDMQKLLPEEVAAEVIQRLEKTANYKEPVREPPKQWIPTRLRESSPAPTLPIVIEPPLETVHRRAESTESSRLPSVNQHEQNKIHEYRSSDRSTAALVKVVIPRSLDFETKHVRQLSSSAHKGPTLTVKGASVQQTIRLITGQETINLKDQITLRVIADILVFSDNLGEVKNRMLEIWLPKMHGESIRQLIENYLHMLQLMKEGVPPDADNTSRKILHEVTHNNPGKIKGIDKTLLVVLIKLVIPLNGIELNCLKGFITILMDYQVIDDTTKSELAQHFRNCHPTSYHTHEAYLLLCD